VNIEIFRDYCIRKPGVSEEFPFDNQTLVFKVGGKMFALTNVDLFERVNLKCDPVRAIALREQYNAVIPGFHMNKKHWNTIKIDGSIPDPLLFEWIDHSYDLVYQNLPGKIRENL
jgi:predicted DNA-binding protein (MmcQ/YjbR family)